jgi:oxaloacetate decarboxylase alpha subunit
LRLRRYALIAFLFSRPSSSSSFSHRFRRIAKEEGLPIGAPLEYDEKWYRHQVPGGMISNLRHQLKILGKENQMDSVY